MPLFAELRCTSAFSFLEGASEPETLVERAAELGLGAVALIDRDNLAGAPRFFKAAREAGLKPLVGAQLSLSDNTLPDLLIGRDRSRSGPLAAVPELATDGAPDPPRLSLLVADQRGYRNLSKLITEAARGHPKGSPRATLAMVERFSDGLHCLAGDGAGFSIRALQRGGTEAAAKVLDRLGGIFPRRLHVELQRDGLRSSELRSRTLTDLARGLRLPLIATGGVRHARPIDRELMDVFTAIRHHTTLDKGGTLLAANTERHLRPGPEMLRRFDDRRHAVHRAWALAEELDFTLDNLGYRFPEAVLPAGETPMGYLAQLTWCDARSRFRPLSARASDQIAKELAMIAKLDLAGYFLIVHDIVRFCQREKILAQGRGSAANSAVCYALGITAVDPVKMELLFERFLSEERGEWPDIDLDLPSGEQREKVIQYCYKRYGPHGAGMTATVISYRGRSAAREVGKALGMDLEQVGKLSKQLGRGAAIDIAAGERDFSAEVRQAGLDPDSPTVARFMELWWRIQNLPRHLGQHSGGMVLAAGRLDEVVPIEPAAMDDRVVIQWDKEDCADLGIVKVDLLGLGMLQAIEEAVEIIGRHEGKHVDLAHLPPDDPAVYHQLQTADTVGIFQVESRAQMASLPRNRPERFYDIVVQVALIRPGPITGNMTNPYLERRQGRQEVVYPHPLVKPILERTLGIPLFQEQLLRLAMTAAGFTGGEAEELRRAMGFKRSVERMQGIEQRLRDGMAAKGIVGKAQEEIVRSITSFAKYGFPESHAASFALIVYTSAWLRAHHPVAFYASLLNAWPMGFYHPATLVKDAQRRGVELRPIDVAFSDWKCTWEDGALRIGLRYLKGFKKRHGEAIENARRERPFSSPTDLALRCDLARKQLDVLAESGALSSFGSSRRAALWQVAEIAQRRGPLFRRPIATDGLTATPTEESPLPEMSAFEDSVADYRSAGLTTGPHLLAYYRPQLDQRGVVPAALVDQRRYGAEVTIAGAVIVRQRPGTAKGIVFLTLEDESGMIQAIFEQELYKANRNLINANPLLEIDGIVQKRDGSLSVKARSVRALGSPTTIGSHDYY